MPKGPLERKNISHEIREYRRDLQTFERYRDKSLLFLEEAIVYIENKILDLEDKLKLE